MVGAKVGPVGMKVTPAGNLPFGIAHHLRAEESVLVYKLNTIERNTRLLVVCLLPRIVDRLQASAIESRTLYGTDRSAVGDVRKCYYYFHYFINSTNS